jgi:hypothetical protein
MPAMRPRPFTPLFLAVLMALAASPVAAAEPPAGQPVLHDARSGLALFGYDPVAYHTEGKPVEGLSAFGLSHLGLAWRFSSAANLAAFRATPDAFVPALGGHDPLSAAEGNMAQGDPDHFLLVGHRLYLFRSEERRREAAENLDVIDRAEAGWRQVLSRQRGQ